MLYLWHASDFSSKSASEIFCEQEPFSFGEVPDFFELTSPSGTTRHVLTICTVNHPVSCPGGWPEHGPLHWHCWIVHAVEYVVGNPHDHL